ncbi:moricin-like [Ostrinia furnacalis]|uniref:Moricin 1 n=1 Tax=Ostrinia furnacalis TaxID=93504 RepID=A0A3G2BAH2_OSTFU|nr:moricin-like [Ostrinia furnacalis]AYM26643.1 moricin 1 [Ostrinia furnacalis]
MKFTAIFMMVMALLAMFVGSHANPAPKVPVKQIGKAVGKGIGVLGAAGTAHEIYRNIKDRRSG